MCLSSGNAHHATIRAGYCAILRHCATIFLRARRERIGGHRASDDFLAYSVLFRLVVITNMELAWSASLGRVTTVIVHPSD